MPLPNSQGKTLLQTEASFPSVSQKRRLAIPTFKKLLQVQVQNVASLRGKAINLHSRALYYIPAQDLRLTLPCPE
jgi:hypothetical protein